MSKNATPIEAQRAIKQTLDMIPGNRDEGEHVSKLVGHLGIGNAELTGYSLATGSEMYDKVSDLMDAATASGLDPDDDKTAEALSTMIIMHYAAGLAQAFLAGYQLALMHRGEGVAPGDVI